jgi:hypothetical protein
VVAARRKKTKATRQWGRRLGGVVLCLFFGLGVLTGLSGPGHALALRAAAALNAQSTRVLAAIFPARYAPRREPVTPVAVGAKGGAVAIVERPDGFYTLYSQGELSGPVAPTGAANLPVLSGPLVANAAAPQLVEYAALLVRAEVGLSELISEMRPEADGTALFFLNHSRTELLVDLDCAPIELKRAGEVLSRWRGHEQLIATLDMTTPGQAVARMRRAKTDTSRRRERASREQARRQRARTAADRSVAMGSARLRLSMEESARR